MHSATGRRGISWYKNEEKWVAYIYYEKKYYYLGTYNDIDSAISARIEAENAKKTENDFAGWYEHWIEDYKRSRKMKGGKDHVARRDYPGASIKMDEATEAPHA